jgi:hypothetical protein
LIFVNLQNESTKAKREVQEQNKYIERLRQKLDDATQFPMGIGEETRQKLVITSNAILANEFKPTFEVFVGVCVNFFTSLCWIMLENHLLLC